jgi:aminomethyltransferase
MSGQSGDLKHTVLHAWHVEAGGKMVDFGGWDMPVQYPSGPIAEHLATRRTAGLFDVSHMGRFSVRGAKAEEILSHTLTNNPRGLEVGESHYDFIANETGGAVDDAYLYKLAENDFLLVVNAANRETDLRWLTERNEAGAKIEDISEPLAMISLQGPEASTILEQLVDKKNLPENKRNRLARADFDGREIIVSRTGYTGEPICFELFVPREVVVSLWQRLVDLGAVPCGLAARDSLRLEAGMPLYGHELGEGPDGRDIPIFANTIAAIAVRPEGSGDYVGRDTLEAQRREFEAIRRGELTTPVAERLLDHLVQPIAVFDSRRPLRAGYRVLLDGEAVGWVTSGTSVPYSAFDGEGIMAHPAEEHALRPIGLALIRSDLNYHTERPILLEVEDQRGQRMNAELAPRNLWSVPPFARPYRGFQTPVIGPRAEASGLEGKARALSQSAAANTRWRREDCINLIPSEQTTSAFVDSLCIADPAGRYNEHNRLKALGPEAADVRYYKGTAFIMDKEEELKAALRTFFDCQAVEPRVISGQMANDTVYDALQAYHNRLRRGRGPERLSRVLVHDLNKGGHLSAQVSGALKNYVALDPDSARPAVEHFPLDPANPHRIDSDAAKELIARRPPELIVFGRSVIIHKEPVAEIARFVHEHFGAENPRRPLIMYDGAHVLGLLGPHFQDPLAEGADVVTGSTHKTFFGPQRGVVLSNIGPGHVFEPFWDFLEQRTFPGHVSNHHLGTLLGLLGATYEMLHFKDAYQSQVIANAKAFARALADQGLSLEGDPALDFTETHQVLLRTGRAEGEALADRLEVNNIITNPQAFWDDPSFAAASGVRMGAQEMTRYGMVERDFAELAALIAAIAGAGDNTPKDQWRDQVTTLRQRFTEMSYCF